MLRSRPKIVYILGMFYTSFMPQMHVRASVAHVGMNRFAGSSGHDWARDALDLARTVMNWQVSVPLPLSIQPSDVC